jgi:hypothetical protein
MSWSFFLTLFQIHHFDDPDTQMWSLLFTPNSSLMDTRLGWLTSHIGSKTHPYTHTHTHKHAHMSIYICVCVCVCVCGVCVLPGLGSKPGNFLFFIHFLSLSFWATVAWVLPGLFFWFIFHQFSYTTQYCLVIICPLVMLPYLHCWWFPKPWNFPLSRPRMTHSTRKHRRREGPSLLRPTNDNTFGSLHFLIFNYNFFIAKHFC